MNTFFVLLAVTDNPESTTEPGFDDKYSCSESESFRSVDHELVLLGSSISTALS
jgi:hypothetical protein